MGYTENINSILKWGNAFQRQFGIPLDRSSLHSSYEDAVAYAKGDGSDERGLGKESYIGQIITVWGLNEKNKEGVWVYSLVPSTKEGYKADLKPVGAGAGTETADTYSAAKTLSEGLVVGQLILVSGEEEVEGQTYKAGFYIVNAPGTISALDTSTGASDEIGALTTRVTSLEGKVTTLEGNRVLTSDFEAYKTQVSTALSGKVDTTTFASYQSDITTALGNKVETTTLTSYQEEVSTALSGKVSTSDFDTYTSSVTTALSGKVDTTTFTSYQSTISTELSGKVDNTTFTTLVSKVDTDINNLTTHLSNYSAALTEVDGRLDALEAFEETHTSITVSDIEGLFAPQSEA